MIKRAIGLFFCAAVLAGATFPGSTPDPYVLNETALGAIGATPPPSRDVTTKTLSSQVINTGVTNLVLFAAGQSNIDNKGVASAYTVVNPSSLDNLNIYDGAIYKAVVPLVGSTLTPVSGPQIVHPALVLADALVSAGKFSRVIIVPIAVGGTTVADWGGGVASGSDTEASTLKTRIPVALARLAQHGVACGTTNVTCAIIWGQGEGDCAFGTSQANYVASFNALVSLASTAGFAGRWFVARQTYNNGATCGPIELAQTTNSPSGVINNASGIYLGANADALVGSVCNSGQPCRDGDNTHFTYAGVIAYATDATYGWQQALHASGAPF